MLNSTDTSEMILALASCDIVKDVTVIWSKYLVGVYQNLYGKNWDM